MVGPDIVIRGVYDPFLVLVHPLDLFIGLYAVANSMT
jgi:hypothetical protein